ncbi:MAG TPA: hypothetical protein VKQ89_02070 [Candidatus Angelobacter sp.]|nr:hypothetical protein [Candidatus Angelobacter sp.]
MIERDHEKHLDELLDSALSEYSAVEPGPGLQTRILAQVREAGRSAASPQWNRRWLWAGAVAAAGILLIVLSAGRHSVVPVPGKQLVEKKQPAAQPAPKVANTAPLPATSGETPQQQEPRQPHREVVALRVGPRQAVFPSPTPLSDQEKLLLTYYSHTPREELIAQSHPEEPPVMSDDQSNIAVPELILVPQKSSNTR